MPSVCAIAVFPIKGTFGSIAFNIGIDETSISASRSMEKSNDFRGTHKGCWKDKDSRINVALAKKRKEDIKTCQTPQNR